MTDSDIRKRYFEALGIQEDAGGRSRLEAALRRAHEIRKFEIDLYWKRATYFWAVEGAAFIGFAAFWREKSVGSLLLAIAFACIGLVTGFAGWLSARGSKFWQESWEKHIDLLEDQFEGHLYKTIWIGPEDVQFSVSRLNERLNLILFLFWAVLILTVLTYFGFTACAGLKIGFQPPPWLIVILALIMISAAAGSLYFLYHAQSELKGKVYEDGAGNWQSWPGDKPKKYRILRRYGPDET